MPRTATQRNQKPVTRVNAPQPVAKTAEAETEDHVYALVSVLYHSLQGAQACEQYMDDAERAGDETLVTFFEECRDQQNERATRAKQLLVQRATEDESDDEDSDDEDNDDEDS